MDWLNTLKEIEDILIPYYQFDIYERGMYLYLFNKTRISGIEYATIPLSQISKALQCSDWQSRKTIRQLAKKGCIELEQTRDGHSVKVLLPADLDISRPEGATVKANIDEIDFFKGREYVDALIKRENNSCFYCLSEISPKNCELDHVVSQLNGGDNSFKNIVASCHKCNTKKQGADAENFLRDLYRKGMLSESEFEGRLTALRALRQGDIKPDL
ncbi:MAG: HNH endonuclease [Sedimentisphaerales bacterium]|nr:HNH endonuclease [Sedimentisphaerales bacterium]